MRILVTGGAGFIGSALARLIIEKTPHEVLVYDNLTYAGNLASLASIAEDPRFHFVMGDICDSAAAARALNEFRPHWVMNLAAESHVDRSIDAPLEFIRTNVLGVGVMLQASLAYWRILSEAEKRVFRFHHISTDEVFGSLGREGAFCEETPYAPNSPYAASKAGSDHLVRAWHHTYGLPTLLTNCSNNYGPYHFPEKLIPLMIINALEGLPLPVYGRGQNVRDWLFVDDHAEALLAVVAEGRIGESYNIGGLSERRNIDVVEAICDLVDELASTHGACRRREQISYVTDRPGHDLRYAIDPSKVMNEIGWRPRQTFESGLRETVKWYLAHQPWWRENPCERLSRRAAGRLSLTSQVGSGNQVQVENIELEGVKLITPKRVGDSRGFFSEVYNRRVFAEAGIDFDFVQDNQSLSREVGTLRGLHFQAPPIAQVKLVRILRGRVFDVAVDIRRGSATYGRWVGVELSAENFRQLLIPMGFLHGFITLEPDTEMLYKVSAPYSNQHDFGVAWNDPDIAIAWPEEAAQPLLSAKDGKQPFLRDLDNPFEARA